MKITCCKCGCIVELNRLGIKTICLNCENEYLRNYEPTRPYLEREKSRSKAHSALKSGKLIQKPCQKCGSKDAEMHHEDYSKPLDVIWLCRTCHLDLHTWKKILERDRSEVKEPQ